MKNRHLKIFAVIIAVSLFFCGCNDVIGSPNLMTDVSAGEVSETPLSAPESASLTDFALRLFKAGNEDGENTLISPLSVLAALSMTANGAKGVTLAEMEAVLGMPVNRLNGYMHSYMNSLPSGEKYMLSLANSIWFTDDSRFTVNEDFLQTNADYFGADIYRSPFDNSTLKDINLWVDQKTDGMIPEILDEIPEAAVMYLINALAFEAEWMEIYTKDSVSTNTFTTADGTSQQVEFMYSTESGYFEDENATGFIKYYKDRKYAFVALLPNEGTTVTEYVNSLDGESLASMLADPINSKVKVSIPKFETEYDTEMSEILFEMGMKKAFNGFEADFSALGTSTAGNIFISRVLHKTFIAVGEKGTKAGAATAVEMQDECAPEFEETKKVYLDRPFVYMLIDCENSIPFFIGTLNEVKAAGNKLEEEDSECGQTEISKYITKENGKYILTLPKSQATIKLRDNEDNFVDYISDALVEAAEQKILQDTVKYSDFPCFYLETREDGELYLAAEVIYYLDEPDENVGCYDHEHLFFREKISEKYEKNHADKDKHYLMIFSAEKHVTPARYPIYEDVRNPDGTHVISEYDRISFIDYLNGDTQEAVFDIPVLTLSGKITPALSPDTVIEKIELIFKKDNEYVQKNASFEMLSNLENGTYYVSMQVKCTEYGDDGDTDYTGLYEDIFCLEVYERHRGEIRILRYSWDGWGISTKSVKDCDAVYNIINALENAKETGKTVCKISDQPLEIEGGEYPAERGTMWIEWEDKIYRLTPELTELCIVETHLGEGKVLEIPDGFTKDVNDLWHYAPYDYYVGTYDKENSEVVLTNVFSSDSSVRISVKDIYIENTYSPKNTVTVELVSDTDRELTIYLECRQSEDNLAEGDAKTVKLQKGVPATVELTFGGWRDFRYLVYIQADLTKAVITVNPK